MGCVESPPKTQDPRPSLQPPPPLTTTTTTLTPNHPRTKVGAMTLAVEALKRKRGEASGGASLTLTPAPTLTLTLSLTPTPTPTPTLTLTLTLTRRVGRGALLPAARLQAALAARLARGSGELAAGGERRARRRRRDARPRARPHAALSAALSAVLSAASAPLSAVRGALRGCALPHRLRCGGRIRRGARPAGRVAPRAAGRGQCGGPAPCTMCAWRMETGWSRSARPGCSCS